MNTRDLGTKFQEWQQRAGQTARTVGHTTDNYVRENTWQTVAIAALMGIVLGYLLSSGGGED